MRETTKIRVERAILHYVEAGPSGLQLSGKELPLDGWPRLVDFLAGHIRNGLQDSQARAARWSTPDGVPGICQALLGGGVDLVTGSQRLATALHTAIGNDQRIAPGALTVAIYSDSAVDASDPERFVALVKLDPSGVFQPRWRTDEDGTRFLAVEELAAALPTLRERLQKCAFVRAARPENAYDLLVLDRQVPEVSAKFFMTDFLGAQEAFEPRTLTEGLYRAMVTARNELADRLTVGRLVRLDDAIRGMFTGTSVDLDGWLAHMPQAERNAIDAEVRRRDLDRAFELDPQVRERLGQKIRYRGDHGLEVRVDRGAFDDMVSVQVEQETPRRFRIVVETSKWELG